MFEKALIPIDGSDVANAAIDCAMRTVTPGTTVVVVQVVDSVRRFIAHTTPAALGFDGATLDAATVEAILEAQRQGARTNLDAARARLVEAGMEDVDTMILEGVPGEQIVRLASSEGFDLVVMATHGRTGLFRTVLGSVAEHVVRNLRDIPVTLIHPSR